jgi:hypothetical protein
MGGVVKWSEWVNGAGDRGRVVSVASRAGWLMVSPIWGAAWGAVLLAIRPVVEEMELKEGEKLEDVDIDTSFIVMVARHVHDLAVEEAIRTGVLPPDNHVSFLRQCPYLLDSKISVELAKRALNYAHVMEPISISPGYLGPISFEVDGVEIPGDLFRNFEFDWGSPKHPSPFGDRWVWFPKRPLSKRAVMSMCGPRKLNLCPEEVMVYTHLPAYPTCHLHIVAAKHYPDLVALDLMRTVSILKQGTCQSSQHDKVVEVSLHRLMMCNFPPPENILVPAVMTSYAAIYGLKLPVVARSPSFTELPGEDLFDAYRRHTKQKIILARKVCESLQSLFVLWFNRCFLKTDEKSRSTYYGRSTYHSLVSKGKQPNLKEAIYNFNTAEGIQAHKMSRDGLQNIMYSICATCRHWDRIDDRLPELVFWVHAECGLGLVSSDETRKTTSSNFDHVRLIGRDYPVIIEDSLEVEQRNRAAERARTARAAIRKERRIMQAFSDEKLAAARAESESVQRKLAAKVAAHKLDLQSLQPEASSLSVVMQRWAALRDDPNARHNSEEIERVRHAIRKTLVDLTSLWDSVGGLSTLSLDFESCSAGSSSSSSPATARCNCDLLVYTCDHGRAVSACFKSDCPKCNLCEDEQFADVKYKAEELLAMIPKPLDGVFDERGSSAKKLETEVVENLEFPLFPVPPIGTVLGAEPKVEKDRGGCVVPDEQIVEKQVVHDKEVGFTAMPASWADMEEEKMTCGSASSLTPSGQDQTLLDQQIAKSKKDAYKEKKRMKKQRARERDAAKEKEMEDAKEKMSVSKGKGKQKIDVIPIREKTGIEYKDEVFAKLTSLSKTGSANSHNMFFRIVRGLEYDVDIFQWDIDSMQIKSTFRSYVEEKRLEREKTLKTKTNT